MLFRKKVKAQSEIMKKSLEHSVMPALDYHFALERYTESDCRYSFVQYFSKLFFERIGIEVFNCKIDVPKINIPKKNVDLVRQRYPKINSIYNICIYLKEPENGIKQPAVDNSLLLEMHERAIIAYPIKELDGLELNALKILDFTICAKAFAINQSINTLREELKRKYSFIKDVTNFDETVYLLYKNNKAFELFLHKENKKELKAFAGKIIERNDSENVCFIETLRLMLLDNKKHNVFGIHHDGVNDNDGILL